MADSIATTLSESWKIESAGAKSRWSNVMFDVTRLQDISSWNSNLLERHAYVAASVYHLTSPATLWWTGSRAPGKGWGGQVGFAGSFVRSFVRGNGDRGSWSPWLPWRGFDEGVWGIDAASSVASGGLRSFGFPSPSGGGVQQVGLSPTGGWLLLATSWIHHVTRIGRKSFRVFVD